MKFFPVSLSFSRLVPVLAALGMAVFPSVMAAQDVTPPALLSASPPNGATGVPVTSAVVFIFSEPMDEEATSASFFTTNFPPQVPLTDAVWSDGGTRLTCTPIGSWPNNAGIQWFLFGADLAGNDLPTIPLPMGIFTTGAGGGQGGSGTNAVTTFQVGVTHQYVQAAAGPPALDPAMSYIFNASTVLSSNRTATNVTITLPTATVQSLTKNPVAAELFFFFDQSTDAATFNPPYNGGNYLFNVRGGTSNQAVTVNLPTSGQPNPPQISNFAASQGVEASQPFTLAWDAFTGGFSAGSVSNFVTVEVEDAFPQAALGDVEFLPKSATSVVIPAGRLQPATTYEASVAFWTAIRASGNSASNTFVWRVTRTSFPLTTLGGGGGTLVLTNWSRLPSGALRFEVTGGAGQTIAVERVDDLTGTLWSTVLTTNTALDRFFFTEPLPVAAGSRFFRARKAN